MERSIDIYTCVVNEPPDLGPNYLMAAAAVCSAITVLKTLST